MFRCVSIKLLYVNMVCFHVSHTQIIHIVFAFSIFDIHVEWFYVQ